ncbi:MAG: hypothetical protein ACJ702_07230 [Nitrososphaeraceae archaeon]
MNRGFLSWVRSNDKEIIDVLEEQAVNLVKATSYLVEFMSSYKMDGESRYKIIKDLEHQGDQITITILFLSLSSYSCTCILVPVPFQLIKLLFVVAITMI